jgi:hypothetical protein
VDGQEPDRFELMIVQQVGFLDFSDRGRPDYASDLRLCVAYMFAMLAWRYDTRWCRGAGRDVGPADQRAVLGSARRASRSVIRRSWKRRLDRAAEVGPVVSAFLGSLERTAINEVAELG